MTSSRLYAFSLFFCLLNLPEILYQISFKLGYTASILYIYIFGSALFILVFSIKSLTKNEIIFLGFFLLYLMAQILSGISNGADVYYTFVVSISLAISFFIYIWNYF